MKNMIKKILATVTIVGVFAFMFTFVTVEKTEELGHFEEKVEKETRYEWVTCNRWQCNTCHENFYSEEDILAHYDEGKEISYEFYEEGYFEPKTEYVETMCWVVDQPAEKKWHLK